MSVLGFYFGPKIISVVESSGKKMLNSFQVSLSSPVEAELEEKVSDEIKIVALIKEEMRKNNVSAKEAAITLSGEDLVIRTFDMPVIPREDLSAAINSEARKYIPFKIEDLFLAYQVNLDKVSQKNFVLLVGIKREVLDKHLSIFSQLELEIVTIEYSAFSILRLLQLSGLKEKGIFGVIDADTLELDEANFTVLENGFPVFSRNIVLRGAAEGALGLEAADSSSTLEKLKTEIRMSLDYYHRKFPTKKIDKAFFISRQEAAPDLGVFAKEIGLASQFIDINKCLDKPVPFSLGFLKAYCSSLARTIRIMPNIDLLSAKAKKAKEGATSLTLALSYFKGAKIDPIVVISSALICIVALVLGFFQKIPLQKELNTFKSMRPAVSNVATGASYEELAQVEKGYKDKLTMLNNLVNKQMYLTEPLDFIPRIIPDGAWLTDFSFKKEEKGADLTLRGCVYLNDSARELEAVNAFVAGLKGEANFNKYFKDIEVGSLERREISVETEKLTVTNFIIYCRSAMKGKK